MKKPLNTLLYLPALFFFISGFCGLVYQLVWMRLAFATFGITTHVLSVVLSVFMAGLGLGSWWAGRAMSRSGRNGRSPLFSYAITEGLIGIGAFAVPSLYTFGAKILLPSGNIQSGLYLLLSGLAILVSLLPWCFCMGATIPFMMAALRQAGDAQRNFSFLYAANSLGAVTGSLLTVVVLVELLGFHQTLFLAGLLNFLLCAVCLWLSSSVVVEPAVEKTSSQPIEPLFMGLLFMTGFTSMAMEVAWIRNFTPILGNMVYSFGFILAVYLLSMTLGAWAYRRFFRDSFSLSSLLGALFVAALLTVILNDFRIHNDPSLVLLSIVPFCGLLGFFTPSLVDRCSQGNPTVAGRAYAINILGCILGPLFCTYFLLPYLGTRLSILLLSLPFAYAALKTAQTPWKRSLYLGGWLGLGSSLMLIGLLWTVDYEECFTTLMTPSIIHRDHTATVIACGAGLKKDLLVNGIGMTGLVPETKVMAHLPLAYLTHRPESALDICFGMGTTFRALSSWGIRTTVVDLLPGVVNSFSYFWNDAEKVAANPLNRIIVDDGRRYMMRTDEQYDIITVDPPPPMPAAGSSLLYSIEFYDVVKKHLKPSGILQQWVPDCDAWTTRSVVRSIVLSFPYVRAFRSTRNMGTHFLCSLSPLPHLTARQMVEKTPMNAQKDLVEFFVRKDPFVIYDDLVKKEVPLPYFFQGSAVPPLTDDHPFNEYYLCRKFEPPLQSPLSHLR